MTSLPTTKRVNGKVLQLSSAEKASTSARWASEDTRAINRKKRGIRDKRHQLLLDTNWTRLDDTSASDKAKYQSYRQVLKAIDPNDLDAVVWPDLPE